MTLHDRNPCRPVRAATATAIAVAVALVALGSPAQARNVRLMESVPDTLRVSHAHEILGNLDLRFGGDSGRDAKVVRRDVVVKGVGTTRLHEVGNDDKVRPSDHELCARAFEDAITQLAFAARGVHATAIVGVVSNYEGTVFDDAGHFECHAGALKAAVTLRAQLATDPASAPAVSVSTPSPPPQPQPQPQDTSPPSAATFQPLPPRPASAPD